MNQCDICGRDGATPIPSALIDGRAAMMCGPCREGRATRKRSAVVKALDDLAGAAGFVGLAMLATALAATPASAQDYYDDECHDDGRLVVTIRNGSSVVSDKELDTCAGTVVLAITVRAGRGPDLPETYAVIDAPPGLIAYPAEIDVIDGEEGTIAFLPGVS